MLIQQLEELRQRLTSVVMGADDAALFLCVALLARGHVLIEGPPGVGKTTIAQELADAINGTCRRIQFTPDLLPSDILGYNLYRQNEGEFEFIKGPVFSNVLLADEINRTSPRVQSALLEAMSDAQVSIDGVTYPLEDPFIVLATQNDTTYTGTFPLPEPQLDRFLLSVPMALPKRAVQMQILSELETPVEVLGPSVAPAEKLRGQYRFHMMVGTTVQGVLQKVMVRAKSKIKSVDDVQWMVDIDPQDML